MALQGGDSRDNVVRRIDNNGDDQAFLFSTTTTRGLLYLEICGATLFAALMSLLAFVIYPTPQELYNLERGDYSLGIRIACGGAIFPLNWSTVMILMLVLHEAAVNQLESVVAVVAVSDNGTTGSTGINNGSGIYINKVALRVIVTVILGLFLWDFAWFVVVGSRSGVVVGGFWIYIVFRFLPAYSRRWNGGETNAGVAGLQRFLRRMVLIGLPILAIPGIFPHAMKHISPDTIAFYYPLFLSFVEYLGVSVLSDPQVVTPYSDEALSIFARTGVAIFESNRIGTLVVMSNSHMGSFEGLVNATIIGVIAEGFARNNLISICVRGIMYRGQQLLTSWRSAGDVVPPPLPPPAINRMKRFKAVYLGVKMDTEYWGVFTLILIKCLGWSHAGPGAPGMDPHSGKLLSILDSSWSVIAVVCAGELSSDLLGGIIRWCMLRWAPVELLVDTPVVTPTNVGVVIVMWLTVGGYFMNGISRMGILSDSLQPVVG